MRAKWGYAHTHLPACVGVPLKLPGLLFAIVIAFTLPAFSQTTTSLAIETGNNTSACSAAGSPLYCQAGFTAMSDGNGTFNPRPGNVNKQDVHSLLYPGSSTQLFAYYMPWFCMVAGSSTTGTGTNCQSHIQVGYTANDWNTVHGQMGDIQSRGFDGVVVPYYAKVKDHDQVTMLVRDEIGARGMKFALMEEQGAFQFDRCPTNGGGVDQTACIVKALSDDMDYMDANYFNRSAYLRIDPATMKPSANGRPYLAFFICQECFTNPNPDWATIWSQVRAHAKTLSQGEPLLHFRNPDGFTHPQTEGAFAWIGMSSTDPYGLNYSNYFYDQSIKFPALDTWGSGWKGFDDSAASWSQNRFVGQQCGRTWLQVFSGAGKDYSTSRQLPFLSVVTWNDYEEGSEIETGIDNCLSLSVTVSGSTLSWQPTFSASSGSEETVSRYVVYELGSDGDTLTQLGSYATSVHSLDLSTLGLSAAVHTLYVQALGKSSILNKMSSPVVYDSTPAPAPIISLTPATMTFASTAVGSTSAAQVATLKNSGTASATLTSISTTGDYAQSTTCGTALAAGASCTISISFRPTVIGTRTGTVSVVDSATGSPHTISLTGSGVTSTSTCALPTSAGVRICSPTNGSSNLNPIRAWARGKVTGTFARMEFWIDGVKKYTSTTDTVDVNYTLSKGVHKFSFYAVNSAGTKWSATANTTVK